MGNIPQTNIPEAPLLGPDGQPFDPAKVPRRQKTVPDWVNPMQVKRSPPELNDRARRKLRWQRRRTRAWLIGECKFA